MRIYPYLRASTKEQDAQRARESLHAFAKEQGVVLSSKEFIENESGAKLERPALFELIDTAESGDVLLVEQVDRISRLTADDWEKLKAIIKTKGIKVVALDLPMSYAQLKQGDSESFDARMLSAMNDMMLDMLAAIARKDYEDRRRRQEQGIEKAKAEGKYRGGKRNEKLRENIKSLLRDGRSYSEIVDMLGCSKGTISNVKKEI